MVLLVMAFLPRPSFRVSASHFDNDDMFVCPCVAVSHELVDCYSTLYSGCSLNWDSVSGVVANCRQE